MIKKCLRPTTIANFTCAIALALSTALSADMSLNPDASSVSLLTTKVLADGSQSVVERHEFTSIAGSVDSDGIALITIPLDSIETNIPIRNERMAEFLFETAKYPNATVSATVPAGMLEEGAHSGQLNVQLSLHGQTQDLTVPVNVHYASDKVMVSASEPVMLDASAFDLDGGIGKLQDLAKLLHIPTTVPVSFSLTFSQ